MSTPTTPASASSSSGALIPGGALADLALGNSPGTMAARGAGEPIGSEMVTCPECGLMGIVEPTKRNSADFCHGCDFPLFWARSTVISMAGDDTGASLRRLPGTAGRAQRASVACPHCGEPNIPVALTCIRCLQPMEIVAPVPPPPPAPIVAPLISPEPEPARNWWWLVVVCFCLLAMTIIIAIATLT
ncbi:hypothetical protein EH165_07515 [Nakamurella antarctica]|uniref:Double zinc ribbon n=1 Tax=Nakamurella antarctica TaxID=1902245 RepID=A0A3G8ZWG2_9ACTN|nr:hypothetical protein [Nakamurella antarctica]AZI58011.1 hypothetical protein EH165_07515 [Nakamurella antarctica]